jgi:hypothetical protein
MTNHIVKYLQSQLQELGAMGFCFKDMFAGDKIDFGKSSTHT